MMVTWKSTFDFNSTPALLPSLQEVLTSSLWPNVGRSSAGSRDSAQERQTVSCDDRPAVVQTTAEAAHEYPGALCVPGE